MLAWKIVFWLSVAVVGYAYLGYPLLLSLCHFFVPRRVSRPDDAFSPTVSLVMAAYNEAGCVRQKIENCLALDYPREKLELLVGSDGSDDGTSQIVAEYADRGVVLMDFHPRRGKMATVNRIVERATGEICVFSDVSELFDSEAVRKLVRHFADPGIGAVTGNHVYHRRETGLGTGTTFYWRFQRFMQGIESRLDTVCQCDGTIYACRRELFPYPPAGTINDDVAVPLGIITRGRRVVFEPEAVIRGDPLPETRRFFRQKIRSQAGKYQTFAAFPRMFLPWPPIRWWIFVSHCVLPVLVPWFLLLALAANGLLWSSGIGLYRLLLAGQAGFYLLAAAGLVAERLQVRLRLAAIPFYFVTANLGSLCGFFAYLAGVQRAAWRKVE